MRTTTGVPASILWASLVLGAALQAADAPSGGTAKGVLTVGSDRRVLAHATARAVEGFFDKTKDDIQVILSDVALPQNGRERLRMIEAGTAHCVKLVINPATNQVINYQIWHGAIKGAAPGGGNTAIKFEPKAMDAKAISGKVTSSGPQEVFGTKFEFSATFEAAVLPK